MPLILFARNLNRTFFFGAKVLEVMIEIYPLLDGNMGGVQEYQKLVTPNLDQ